MEWAVIVPVFLVICGVLIALIAYTPVENGEVVVVRQFGEIVRILKPGFNLIIPFLQTASRLSTRTVQREFPADPENVETDDANRKTGQKRPFRIVHKGMEEANFYQKIDDPSHTHDPKDPLKSYRKVRFSSLSQEVQEAMKKDPAHAPLTSEIPVVVEWHNMDSLEAVINFFSNVDDSSMSREEEVNRRLNDKAARALQELLGDVTLGHAQEMMAVFNAALKVRMEAAVGEIPDPSTGTIDKPWGIHIGDAYFKEGELGRTVNKARADAAAAVSERREKILDSEAEAQTIRNKADATAHETRVMAEAKAHEIKQIAAAEEESEKAKGRGEAGRIEEMAKVMKDPNARFIAQLDVAEMALTAPGRTLFVPTQVGQIASILTLGQDLSEQQSAQENSQSPSRQAP